MCNNLNDLLRLWWQPWQPDPQIALEMLNRTKKPRMSNKYLFNPYKHKNSSTGQKAKGSHLIKNWFPFPNIQIWVVFRPRSNEWNGGFVPNRKDLLPPPINVYSNYFLRLFQRASNHIGERFILTHFKDCWTSNLDHCRLSSLENRH